MSLDFFTFRYYTRYQCNGNITKGYKGKNISLQWALKCEIYF